MSAARDGEALRVDACLEGAVDRVEEVLAVIAQLEAEQVVAQQAVEQLLLPGEGPHDLAVRPGDVPELRDDQAGIALLEHPGEQPEVVVLDEDQGRPVARLLDHRVGEQGVDLAVRLPVAVIEGRPREGDVAQRPEPGVGHAEIVALLLGLRQPDPPQRVEGILRGDAEPPAVVGRPAVGVAGAVGHPGAAAGPQDRVERRRHPARRADDLDLARPACGACRARGWRRRSGWCPASPRRSTGGATPWSTPMATSPTP